MTETTLGRLRLRNVMTDPVTTCDIWNRTPVTFATYVTGKGGGAGAGLAAVGGCSPLRAFPSRSVAITLREIGPALAGGHAL